MNLTNLHTNARKWFNKFIRMRDCDDQGFGTCISSNRNIRYGKNIHAGHFWNKNNYPWIEFDEDNVHGQSHSDNTYKGGNLLEYRYNLIQKIGQDKYDLLEIKAMSHKGKPWKLTFFEKEILYKQIIEIYKAKCKQLAKQKMFKP